MPILNISQIMELTAGTVMLVGILGALFVQLRLLGKKKTDWGFDARAIQFVAVVLVIPSILILALEKILTTETTATLIGALTGYLLSGIGEFKPSARPSKQDEGEADTTAKKNE